MAWSFFYAPWDILWNYEHVLPGDLVPGFFKSSPLDSLRISSMLHHAPRRGAMSCQKVAKVNLCKYSKIQKWWKWNKNWTISNSWSGRDKTGKYAKSTKSENFVKPAKSTKNQNPCNTLSDSHVSYLEQSVFLWIFENEGSFFRQYPTKNSKASNLKEKIWFFKMSIFFEVDAKISPILLASIIPYLFDTCFLNLLEHCQCPGSLSLRYSFSDESLFFEQREISVLKKFSS